ncbi:MAG TPA: amino acid adenylation domain-containing protein [Thermoanaerobaculia bacterium]|nr:amino acid adenylation domain-containing protein [Thermoanaerobaculia bacterium]
MTPNGKVDRKALPAPQSAARERAGAETRLTEMQELLAGIWSEVLGRGRVGAGDNFFDLGGHSLLATRVASRVRTVLGVELPLRAIFEQPTVAGLAERVQAAQGIPQPPPIVPVSRDTPEGGLPLSFAQQRFWLLDQLKQDSAAYNIPLAVRMTGALQVGLLERVFAEMVRRHETLRTTFASREGSPIQVIAAPRVELPVLDLSHLPDPEERALGLSYEEAWRPFDLERGPLLRLVLLRLGERDHVLLLTMHHIISDAWSMGVLLREIGALLAASPLPKLPVQYADFAVWQRSWLQGEVLEAQLAYWRHQFAGAPQVLELPTDRPRPAAQTFRGASQKICLPPELSAAVHGLCRREGVTPFMALLAAWAVLLGRHANQEDVLVGTSVAGRNRREVEDLIGLFVNTLALRVHLTESPSGAPGFGELLGRVRRAALDGYTHQDVPFERLVEELAPERSQAHSPLFQVMLVLQNAPGEGLSLPGLTLTPLALDGEVAKFDLTLALEERRDRVFEGALEYNTDLFDGSTAVRMLERWQLLLDRAVADPARPVAELPLLTEAERFQLLSTWNDTAAAPLAEPWLHVRFQAVAARYLGEVALIQAERRLTFEDVAHRAERLAAGLADLGVGPEVVVGLRFERSPELVIAALGVLMAGGAYLPLDPAHPEERQATLLADAGAALVLSRETWPDAAARALPAVDPEGLAYVLYTSGSTGRPKGVMVQHRALARYLDWAIEAYAVEAGQGAPVHSSLAFDLTVTGLWVPLLAGRPVTLLPEEHGVEALAATVRPVADFSLVKLTPAHLDLLAQQVAPESVAGWTRALVVGGEALRQESLAFWRAHAPATRIFNEYGPTETVVGCSVYEVPVSAGSLPIGRPIAGARLYVLDRGLHPSPVGVIGELWIGGEGVTRGYRRDPWQTAERFFPDAFSTAPGARLYRSGDLARWRANGVLEYLGRTDHQLKVRGFRIEPGEIESVLRRHPAVRDVAVLARPGALGDASLAAFVAADPAALTGAELRDLLARHLPDYMVPAAMVVVDDLPLTSNGKVDREALLRLEPVPQEVAASPAAPRTPEEELMAGLFAQVLGIEQVGLDDNFFDLGGHSLLAMQLIARVREIWQAKVSLVAFFKIPTVASLLARLRSPSGAARELPPPFERGPAGEDAPLSFAQMRLWIVDQIEPDSPAYNIPFALRLRGRLSREALDAAIGEVVRRHEILRTTFPAVLGDPVQRISPPCRHLSPLLDLSALRETREDQVLALAREEVLRPFDLAAGPLFRSTLLRLGDADHVLLFTLHHIIGDGWSTGVLVREVGEFYRALLAGRPSSLPELPIQYADYSRWQRRWLQGEVLEEQLEYWRRQLAPPLPVLDLPTDRPRPAAPSGHGDFCELPLTPELSDALIGLGRQQGTTLFMTLLAGFYALLQRYTSQDDLVIGTDIANRGNLETQALIGFFVNQLVLRVGIGPAASFEELLGQVRTMALEAYGHQDLPFERLVKELQPERDLARQALFQVTFTLQNDSPSKLDLEGLTLEPLQLGSATAKLDLRVEARQIGRRLILGAEYSLDLFDDVRIERLLLHFAALLQEVAARPQGRLSEFDLLSAAERSCLMLEIGDGGEAPVSPGFMPELFFRRAAEHPDVVALAHGGEQWTYGALAAWTSSLARVLRRSGVGCEARVGVFGERGPGMLAAMLAILEAGGAFVPLEPQLPDARLASILATAQPRCIVASRRFDTRAELLAGPAAVLLWDDDGRAEGSPRREPPAPIDPRQLACVFYTSGSTGMPKGAMVEHQGMLNHLLAKVELLALSPGSVVVQNASHGFDISVWQFLAALLAGGRVVVYDEETALDPIALLRALARDGATVLETVPTLLEPLLTMSSQLAAEGEEIALPALSCLISNAETLPVPLARRWFEQYGEVALFNTYGATECSDDTTHWRMREAPGEGCVRVAVGSPIRGFRIHVVDRWGRLIPRGCVGEIAMAGVGVGRGYLGDAEKTARTFMPDPFSGLIGERMYRTGDLGRWTEQGELEFLGRRDHQVKVRGHRVELGEIEAVLGRHPQVREVAVLAREDGHGPARLVAYVIPRTSEPEEGTGEPELRLRDFVAGALPAWMVPSAFVTLPEFPLTPNGKLDRRALPAPDARPELAEDYTAPQGAVEKTLAEIWAQVIGIDRVGLHDNFFELGGDSILAIQIAALAHRASLGVTPRDLFLHQTVAELAVVARSQEIVRVTQELVSGPVPLTPIQHWFFEQGLAAPWHFNQTVFLQIQRRLDPAALHRVVAQLLRHHDALRLRFWRQGDEWRQLHAAPDESVPFAHIDLTMVPESLRASVIEAAAAAAQTSLDLAAGPLLRYVYFDLGPHLPPRLLLIVHHLVVDGVSWRVLLEDLETGYRQAERGEAIELPAKTSSFKAWAERLDEHVRAGGLEEEAAYWLATERALAAPLPVSFPEGANTVSSARTVSRTLGSEETTLLLQEVPKAYSTQIDDVLMTALALACRSWLGGGAIQVVLESHGRIGLFADLNLSRTVGWFTSEAPVLLDVNGAATPGDALKSVKEQLRAVPNEGVGYGALRYLGPQWIRDRLRELPPAQMIFNYLGQLDRVLPADSLFLLAEEASGPTLSPHARREHVLELEAGIAGGRMSLSCTYSENLHARATIERLADSLLAELRSVIAHCADPDVAGYTPSDFPQMQISQGELDDLLSHLEEF